MDNFSTQPDANVVFYPFKYEDPSNAPKGKELDVTELSAQASLIEVQTSKNKSSPGSFSIMLASDRNWKSLLSPGSWVLIYMSDQRLTGKEDSDPDSGLKMIGVIRSVRRIEQIDPQTATKRVRFLITGEDFQSVFNTPIYLNANLYELVQGSNVSAASALLIFGKNFQNAFTPSLLVKTIVDALLGKPAFEGEKGGSITRTPLVSARSGQPYRVPAEVSRRILGKRAAGDFFTGLITFFLQGDLLGEYINKPEVSGVQSVWSIMKAFCHDLLNELYTDLLPVNVDGKTRLLPSLILRAIPFSSKPNKPYRGCIAMSQAGGANNVTQRIAKRATNGVAETPRSRKGVKLDVSRGAHFYVSHDISEGEVVGLNVGKSDRERFNFFLVFPNLGPAISAEKHILSSIISSAGIAKVANIPSIARYGLRPFITSTPYIAIKQAGANLLAVNSVIRDLWERASLFESGQVELIGQRFHVPVGTNIRFKERGWLAHVEQVDHVFRVDQATATKAFRTNIAFVRLQTLDGQPVDLTEQTEEADERGEINMKNEYGVDRGSTFTRLDKDE